MRAVSGSHVVETAGARVVIDESGVRLEGAVKGATMFGCAKEAPGPEPQVTVCPVRGRLYDISIETRNSVIASVHRNIAEYGMFTPDRKLEDDTRTVTFGASEIIADAMDAGMVDCVVMPCDGAGTVLLTRPEVVRAVGAHMTGMLSTSPIRPTMDGLLSRGSILVDEGAGIDQLQGTALALKEGFSSIAATIVGRENHLAHQIKTQAKGSGAEIHVFACHNTGVCPFSAQVLAGFSDVIYAGASQTLRDVAGPKARLQMGSSVPVFAMTDAGKRLMLNSAAMIEDTLLLLKQGLPGLGARQPKPMH